VTEQEILPPRFFQYLAVAFFDAEMLPSSRSPAQHTQGRQGDDGGTESSGLVLWWPGPKDNPAAPEDRRKGNDKWARSAGRQITLFLLLS
jgi:hypothetical protein